MKKKKQKYPKCPCCGIEKHRTEVRQAISILEKIARQEYKHYKELGFGVGVNDDYEWACDECLASKKAIEANPGLQNYCLHPHIAYSDVTFNCNTCGNDFIFSKEEKKFWYENLKFWIDSRPNNCVDCRKEIRQLKIENKLISGILSKEESEMTHEELESVIAIYSKWEKLERAKYYTSVLKKK